MNTKIAVSVPEDLVQDAHRAVAAGSARSVSAYVTAALENYRHRQTLRELLDEWDAELGPPSTEAQEWARESLGLDT